MRHLRTRSGRRESGTFAVEGPAGVREAVLCASKVRVVYATASASERHRDILDEAHGRGIQIMMVTDDVIEAMAETQSPQGIIAQCDLPEAGVEDIVRRSSAMVVALESASDPGNAGTIIRTADAAGADGVLFTQGSVDPFGGKCVRASAGSIFHLPVAESVDIGSLVASVARAGMLLVVATGDGEHDLFDWLGEAPSSICWAFGNEAHGVSDELRGAADVRVRIPLLGRAESLNVASAATVCLFADAARRRGRLLASRNDLND